MVGSSKRNKVYFVGGISGVGKSSVLKTLQKSNQQFQIIQGSKYFMKWLGLKTSDYNTLQSLPNRFKNKELKKMMQFLIYNSLNSSKSVLINAHFLRIHNGEITNAVGNWISLFDGLFFINADPKKILERINYDFLTTGRDRKLFYSGMDEKAKLNFLKYCIKKNLQKIQELSNKFKIPYFIINNKDGMINETVKNLKMCIHKIEGKFR